MATLKQIRANRLNAQNGTGPNSAEGKARSSANALKSGIHAESEVLPWEDPDERATLRAEYHAHHQPDSPEARAMVDNLVHDEFLNRRFRRAEVKIVIAKIPCGADPADPTVIGQAYSGAGVELSRLQRRMDANNRNFHRDLDELRLLEAGRPSCEPTAPLVLLPSRPEPTPSEPADPDLAVSAAADPSPSAEPAADVPPDSEKPEPEPPEPAAGAAPDPSPSAEPAANAPPDPQPLTPNPQPPLLEPPLLTPPVTVLVGLRSILKSLSQNLTPTQMATLTLVEAATLRKSPALEPAVPETSGPQSLAPAVAQLAPAPGPRPLDPQLSTTQPHETTMQTQQMASFRQNPEFEPPAAPELACPCTGRPENGHLARAS